MPQHKSCKKRIKTSSLERARNRAIQSQMSGAIKSFRNHSKKSEAAAEYNNVMSIIDKAARKHIIHNRKADRSKSRLTLHFNKLPD